MLRQEILGPGVEEKRPRENEERYRAILEGIEDGYYEVDLAGNFTFFNDSLCRMFGYPPDELMGMNNREYTDAENARKLYQAFNKVYRTGETVKAFDWEVIRKDGTKRFAEASVSLIRNSTGQPAGFRGIVRDITERKRMEREIEERQEYLVSVLRNAPDAIVTLDAANRILEWNPAAERLFGYTYDEVVGKDIDDVVTRPDVKEQAILFTKQVLSRKNIPPTEVVRYRKDGTPLNVIVAGSPIIIEQEMRGAVIVYADITERKRLEEQLRDTVEKLKASHEELSTPVVQIWDRVLALPLIGVVDSLRAQKIMETLLNRIVETQSEMVILDITGVSSIDTQVVNHLIKTIQAARLLGAECVITGIRPEIAQTMIHLGLDMESFPTRRSLRDGLMYALEKLGYRVGGRE
ncbi:PAS domain S-box protein [Dehalococcoidia bacterium]|nr:PAS domain S-box protein [Dehalococcoidia bacterium]